MKCSLTYFSFLLINFSLIAQYTEFEIHENGLIYDEHTVDRLKLIVDSLNLKFTSCDLTKDYQAKIQGEAYFVRIKSKVKSKKAIEDIRNGISWDAFKNKYHPEIEESQYVVKGEFDLDGEKIIKFVSINSPKERNPAVSFSELKENDYTNGNWAFDDYKGLEAFYFLDEIKATTLPYDYARLVQYSNCLIDTTSSVYYEDAADNSWNVKGETSITRFLVYANTLNNRREFLDGLSDTTNEYWSRYHSWDSLRYDIIEKKLPDEKFINLLNEATDEAIAKKISTKELEEYVGRFSSKELALELKRNRYVMGSCSMDASPRIHLQEIALLSAETANWEVFLRSHLDIMNDNIDRISDGSWAWLGRKTYLKELEILDIDILDLLIGISLRIENPSENHYFGNIFRVGRALSDYSNREEFEEVALGLISDKLLDNYNKLIIYRLFETYKYYLEEESDINRVENKLILAKKELPEIIRKGM